MGFAVFLSSPESPRSAELEAWLGEDPACAGRSFDELARSAHGVLLCGLAEPDATRISERLVALGARVGEDSWLQLPRSRAVRRMQREDSGYRVDGAHGGDAGQELSMARVALIVVGRVSLAAGEGDSPFPSLPEAAATSSAASEPVAALWMDVFLRSPARRIRIRADRFHYGCLDGPPALGAEQNFRRLCAAMAELFPGAAGQRGLQAVLLGGAPPQYPSAREFDRECAHGLFVANGGDRARYVVEDEGDGPLLDRHEVESFVSAMRRGSQRREASKRPRGLSLVLQLLVIGAMCLWLLHMVGQFSASSTVP